METNTSKYLGVQIDNKLSWKDQINAVKLKVSKGIGILAKLRCYLPLTSLKNLYNAFIQPHINYCLTVWGEQQRVTLTNQNCLKKAVRVISFKKKHDSTKPLFKSLGILPLSESISHIQGKFMWNHVHSLHPKCIQEIFSKRVNDDEKNKLKVFLPFCRTSLGQRFITYSGPKLWNNHISDEMKQKPSLSTF